VQIGKTTPVFGHVQSQCTNIMRELGVLGFWVFGCLVGVGGRPSFHSSQKMPRVCFGHACNKKGVASLAKGVVRNG